MLVFGCFVIIFVVFGVIIQFFIVRGGGGVSCSIVVHVAKPCGITNIMNAFVE